MSLNVIFGFAFIVFGYAVFSATNNSNLVTSQFLGKCGFCGIFLGVGVILLGEVVSFIGILGYLILGIAFVTFGAGLSMEGITGQAAKKNGQPPPQGMATLTMCFGGVTSLVLAFFSFKRGISFL